MQRLLICGLYALVGLAPVAAQAPAVNRSARTVEGTTPPKILLGTRPTAFGTIQGNALDAANGALPERLVRLRDARVGRGVASQWTDKAGLFEFRVVDPGSYVVELLDRDQAVVAASQIVVIDGGEAASVVVRLPSRVSPAAGAFGTSARAVAITAAAAAAGVLTTTVGRTVVSPE